MRNFQVYGYRAFVEFSIEEFQQLLLAHDDLGFDMPKFEHAEDIDWSGHYGPFLFFSCSKEHFELAKSEILTWIADLPARLKKAREEE